LYKYLFYAVLVQNSLKERDVLRPVISNVALEMPLGTARIVRVRLLQLNWDTSAEMSRLSGYVYCSWIGTQRNCQGTSIEIELGHSWTVYWNWIWTQRNCLFKLNLDTVELSRLPRYIYWNLIGTQRNCLLKLNLDTAELSI